MAHFAGSEIKVQAGLSQVRRQNMGSVVPEEMRKRNDFVMAKEMETANHIIGNSCEYNLGEFQAYFEQSVWDCK